MNLENIIDIKIDKRTLNKKPRPQTENYNYWNDEQDLKLKELLDSAKYSFKEISAILNRSVSSCKHQASRKGWENKNVFKIHSVNEDFWLEPNNLNSYWAGFTAADGCVKVRGKYNNHYTYTLGLKGSEIYHLQQFKKDCNFTGIIYERTIRKNNYKFCILNIHSDKWAFDLKNTFNIEPLKTYRLAPPLLKNNDLLFYWLIGYIDGDGCIVYNQKYNQIRIKFVSASQKIIEWIKSFTDEKFPLKIKNKPCNIQKHKTKECWTYNIAGIKALIIIDFLRKFDCPKMSRKWNQPLILELIEKQKIKYPELFINS